MASDRALDDLPAGLHVNNTLRVLICSIHNSCYTNDGYKRHLLDLHQIKGSLLKSYCQIITAANLHASPSDVPQPINTPPAIEGLKVQSGFGCNRCNHLSINRGGMMKHIRTCRRNLNIQSGLEEVPAMQSLWVRSPQWFKVQPFTASEPEPGSDESEDIHLINSQRDSLNDAFDQAQAAYYSKYESVNEPAHISEYTPWLRASNFAAHLQGLTLSELADVYALPDEDDEPALFYVIQSAERTLERLHAQLKESANNDHPTFRVLHRQIVNTFRGNEMNVDPINALQNAKSLKIYITTWKQALCYFYRVSMEGYLRENLFKSTIEQTAGFAALLEAGQNRPANVSESGADHDDDDHDHEALQGAWEKEIDDWMLKFSSALIQQHLQFRAFDSPLISFLAARAYNSRSSEFPLGLSLPHTNCYDGPITQRVDVWYPCSAVSGVLSHIVYAMQLIMLGHCLQVYREQPIEAPAQDFTAILKTNCQDWVLNDSKGPMAEILRLRLLAIHIAGETVRQAQIRWKDDGQNLIFKDIQFGLRPLQAWIREVLREANEIMEECLCLGLDDIPILKPHDWRDNWEESRPGRSFIDDPRNQSRHEGKAQWLYRQILERPSIRQRFFKQDTNGRPILVPLAAHEYEKDVQRFLERLMVLLHVSSGQPGRRPEFIGK